MESACCPNRKCKACVDVKLTNCSACGTGISPRHRNGFNEVMELTKLQLGSMKEVACRFPTMVTFIVVYFILFSLQIWMYAKYC